MSIEGNGSTPVKHLTADQLAERWGISRYSVYEKVKKQQIPALKIGRAVRFRIIDVEAWEAKQVQTVRKDGVR